MPYAPYVERLIEEHKQLSERLDKLVAFLEAAATDDRVSVNLATAPSASE